MPAKGKNLIITAIDRLREAIQKKLFADLKDVVKITTSTKTPDENQLKKINEVINRLVDEYGYTPASANELVAICGKFVKSLMLKKCGKDSSVGRSPCRNSLKGLIREVKSMTHPPFIVSRRIGPCIEKDIRIRCVTRKK